MKLLLSCALLLLISLFASADCNTAPPVTVGGSVVCVSATQSIGTTNSMSSAATTTTGVAGRAMVVFGYLCAAKTNCAVDPDWTANHTYGAGSYIMPLTNNPCGFEFIDTTTGTSGGSNPTFSTTPCNSSAATISDNGIVWTKLLLTISDNVNNPETCFTMSPKSPVLLQGNGTPAPGTDTYFNMVWYCPSIPSGVTTVTLTCTVSASCGFITIEKLEFTGMCNSAPCIDIDGYASAASATGLTVNTGEINGSGSSGTHFTNELVIAIAGTANDLASYTFNPCIQAENGDGQNPIMYSYVTNAAVQSCGYTIGTTDTTGSLLVAIKSAASVSVGGGNFPRVVGK